MVTALVRRPGPRLGEGIVTHVPRRPVDVGLALEQWRAYAAALEGAGWTVVEAPPADELPDACFVEDVLVAVGDLVIATQPGAEPRRAEVDAVAETAARLGRRVQRIDPPATLDGGDVLAAGGTLYVGTGGRTNAAGAAQLAALAGRPVVEVPVAGFLHLKSAVTALPDGTLIGLAGLSLDVVAVPEPSGANVLDLGAGRVMLAADCPRTADLVASRGYEPVVVDISELQKVEAGVTCLSVPFRPTI